MKRILILLTILSYIMTVACSGSSEELSKKEEPEPKPEMKDTTNITDSVYTDTIWVRPVYFYDEFADVAKLPKWMIHDTRLLAREYPDGLDVYLGLYKHDTIYIAMTATSGLPPFFDKKGNPIIWTDIDLWSHCEWKRIFTWRPDVWNDSLEAVISDPFIFRSTIYIPDELVDTTALPAWTAHDIYYYTKKEPIGFDIYRGEYENDTIYMTMTIIFDHPHFFNKNGESLYRDDIYRKSVCK